MGRAPTRNKNLPAGMRARHRGRKTYYFLDTGEKPRKEISLGQDYVLAVQKWAELTVSARPDSGAITFRYAAERYVRDVLPKKGLATRADNLRELANLYRIFDDPPMALDDIEPVDVKKYMDWRASGIDVLPAPVRANREKALLSHIWNYARSTGLTKLANPCAGVKGFKELGRDIYIDELILQAVYDVAEVPLKDAIDLAYLTGQRPADVLKLSLDDVDDGALTVVQNKTGKRLRVAVEGRLLEVIERTKERKAMGRALINNKKGYGLSKAELRGAFDRARDMAIEASQIAFSSVGIADISLKIRAFQFRDLRAKAGTDTEERAGMAAAKDQLGHSSEVMTSQYVRHRRGKLVPPTR